MRYYLRQRARNLSKHDINDVIQDTHLRMLTARLPDRANIRCFEALVCRFAHCALIDWLRNNRVVLNDVVDGGAPETDLGPEQELSNEQEYQQIMKIVDELPPQLQQVLKAKLQGVSTKEIAARMGLTTKTVANYLGLARNEVRNRLRALEHDTSRGDRCARTRKQD